ncbi:hypothetical protein BOTBODRAFT_46009 [Botryobasidium botryosum FD-172 SS1]|uniref:Uncharacterized protein n=1 Tax=Botryobasidium botryosum (strain FD-172 SS1) TaxID=930990 RepID=A0A067MJU0_BOTB1|nr:hypothetical protein BOTBODRAFT_46009 [Botryobasidium botryosum FD-172 SS1]
MRFACYSIAHNLVALSLHLLRSSNTPEHLYLFKIWLQPPRIAKYFERGTTFDQKHNMKSQLKHVHERISRKSRERVQPYPTPAPSERSHSPARSLTISPFSPTPISEVGQGFYFGVPLPTPSPTPPPVAPRSQLSFPRFSRKRSPLAQSPIPWPQSPALDDPVDPGAQEYHVLVQEFDVAAAAAGEPPVYNSELGMRRRYPTMSGEAFFAMESTQEFLRLQMARVGLGLDNLPTFNAPRQVAAWKPQPQQIVAPPPPSQPIYPASVGEMGQSQQAFKPTPLWSSLHGAVPISTRGRTESLPPIDTPPTPGLSGSGAGIGQPQQVFKPTPLWSSLHGAVPISTRGRIESLPQPVDTLPTAGPSGRGAAQTCQSDLAFVPAYPYDPSILASSSSQGSQSTSTYGTFEESSRHY